MKPLHILTLGAGGFIGSHLTSRLLREGHRVIALDTHADKLADVLDHRQFTFVEHDIFNHDFPLEQMIEEADLVVDLIAHANPGLYVRQPLDVFRLNFNENLRIAELCVKHQRRLIQFSSCEVYGKSLTAVCGDQLKEPHHPAHATFAEDTTDLIMGPVEKHRWIYACAKQLLERVLHAHGLERKLNYTIIRPFNFIGPKIDYLPRDTDGVPRVFSYFMEALQTGEPMKLVNGGDHQRCYTYIDDAVECIYRIVLNPDGVCDRQIFNIGSPANEISIRELAHLMRDLFRDEFAPANPQLPEIISVTGEEFYGEGYEDSDRRIPDITKARTLLGWEPTWAVRDLLRETMAYYMSAYPKSLA